MKRVFLLGVLIASIGISGFSQSTYDKAIGLRISESHYDLASVSYKFFVSEPGALELNGGFGARRYAGDGAFGLSAAITYQHHFDIGNVSGLKWYIGGGIIAYNVFANGGSSGKSYRGFAAGLYPTGGVDYKFSRIPLNLSADYRPTIFFARPDYYNAFYGTNFGVSARYAINRK